MKKPLVNVKIPSIKRLRRRKEDEPAPSRITNETVAEHRERILAGGRKFKYPVQYAKHKLVFNAIIITVAVLILAVLIGWWQLYPAQNTSALMYRITRIAPVPVAVVNGEQVPYRDYLLQYRVSEYYHEKFGEIKLNTPDGKRLLDYDKRQSLNNAEQVAYARQLSHQLGVTVSKEDVDSHIDKERNMLNGRATQETYDASIKMYLGQTTEDYRLSVKNGILKRKVAFALDKDAEAQAKRAKELADTTNADFSKVAEQLAGSKGAKAVIGQSGMVDTTSRYGGLRVDEIAKLNVGDVSGILKSSTTDDGYYIVKVMNKTDAQIDFAYIHVPLSKFEADFAALKKSGKITEYIKLTDQ